VVNSTNVDDAADGCLANSTWNIKELFGRYILIKEMLEENMETLQMKKWEENFHIQNAIKRIDQRLCNKNLQIIGFHKKKLDNKSNN
jgi:hypothetical protein